jgi:hypothetical protein
VRRNYHFAPARTRRTNNFPLESSARLKLDVNHEAARVDRVHEDFGALSFASPKPPAKPYATVRWDYGQSDFSVQAAQLWDARRSLEGVKAMLDEVCMRLFCG